MVLNKIEEGKLAEVKAIWRRIYLHPDQDFLNQATNMVASFLKDLREKDPTYKDVYLWHMLSGSTGGTIFDFGGELIYTFMKEMEKRIP